MSASNSLKLCFIFVLITFFTVFTKACTCISYYRNTLINIGKVSLGTDPEPASQTQQNQTSGQCILWSLRSYQQPQGCKVYSVSRGLASASTKVDMRKNKLRMKISKAAGLWLDTQT